MSAGTESIQAVTGIQRIRLILGIPSIHHI